MSGARERLLALRLELEGRGEYAPAPPATVVAAGDALVVTAYAARVVKGSLCVTGEIQYLPAGHDGPVDTDALELEALERAFPGLTRTGERPMDPPAVSPAKVDTVDTSAEPDEKAAEDRQVEVGRRLGPPRLDQAVEVVDPMVEARAKAESLVLDAEISDLLGRIEHEAQDTAAVDNEVPAGGWGDLDREAKLEFRDRLVVVLGEFTRDPEPATAVGPAGDEYPPSEPEALPEEEPAAPAPAREAVDLRQLPINTAPARPALDDPEPEAPDEPRGTEQVKSLARQALNSLIPKCARDRKKAIGVAADRIREAFGVERSDELTEAQAAELLDWARRYRPPVVDDFDPNLGRRRAASPPPAAARAAPAAAPEPSLDDRIMDVYLTECQGALDQEAEAAMIETGYARVSEAGAFETLPEGEVAEAVKVETLRRLEAVVKRATVLN